MLFFANAIAELYFLTYIHCRYESVLTNVTFDAERAPVWAAVGLPLSLVQNSDADWILAADCDMMFINMDVRTLKSICNRLYCC